MQFWWLTKSELWYFSSGLLIKRIQFSLWSDQKTDSSFNKILEPYWIPVEKFVHCMVYLPSNCYIVTPGRWWNMQCITSNILPNERKRCELNLYLTLWKEFTLLIQYESMLQLTGTELMGTTPKDVQVTQKKKYLGLN